jgi:hypothetical protein
MVIPGSVLTLTEAATPFASGVYGASLPQYGLLDIQVGLTSCALISHAQSNFL